MEGLLKIFSEWQWPLWGLSSGILTYLAYKQRAKHLLSIEKLIPRVGLPLASIFSLTKVVLYIAVNRTEIQSKLDWDGLVVTSIGCALAIVLSLKEVRKLL